MAPKYKLTYFNVRGRAELARLIFAAAGVEFEDARLDGAQWAAIKETAPMGQLPLLEVDGKTMCQSTAIFRYVAKETGLSGKPGWEEAQADMFVCGMEDLFIKLVTAHFEQDEAKKEGLKKELVTFVPQFLGNYEKLCGPDGYFVGSSLTYADLAFFAGMHNILKERADALENFPKLAKVIENVKDNKGVAAYIAERPDTAV
ncbi:hematopoietic prostaglandin D synthase-like [Branchiostoma floridae x Branchiostoma belcheri]|nr:hypothetical protein Bbelb_016540 [Branchiostoma belcheri]